MKLMEKNIRSIKKKILVEGGVFLSEAAVKQFRNIHRKKPVLVSLFNKIAGMNACKFTKKRL